MATLSKNFINDTQGNIGVVEPIIVVADFDISSEQVNETYEILDSFSATSMSGLKDVEENIIQPHRN